MLGIENGYAIGKDITNVERFRHRGVVYMTLCHNGNNDICGSARYNEEVQQHCLQSLVPMQMMLSRSYRK